MKHKVKKEKIEAEDCMCKQDNIFKKIELESLMEEDKEFVVNRSLEHKRKRHDKRQRI